MIQKKVWTYDDFLKFSDTIMPHLRKQWDSGIDDSGIDDARFSFLEIREILKDNFPEESRFLSNHLSDFLNEMLVEMYLYHNFRITDDGERFLSVANPERFK